MGEFTHFDERGASRMVNVSDKPVTHRVAIASGRVAMAPQTLQQVLDRQFAKGDVIEIARLAGIMAAKRTSDLIPLCHPLPLTSVRVDLEPEGPTDLVVRAECRVDGRTGVEMEALTAVAVACLTVYDMCKSVDRSMRITDVQLESKSGGRSGTFVRGDRAAGRTTAEERT
jgi:cyclic pyranopterin phosphate synthase